MVVEPIKIKKGSKNGIPEDIKGSLQSNKIECFQMKRFNDSIVSPINIY